MTDFEPGPPKEDPNPPSWEEHVDQKERRMLRARREKNQSIWFGFGMFGVIGWSIVVPTLLGIFLGLWIDRTWPNQFSWTLMLMLAGLLVGCLNAWNWVNSESGMRRRKKERDRNGDR
jgi:ATP synthase protein I